MGKWKVNYKNIKTDDVSFKTLCGGFENDTIFYGEKEGDFVSVDFSKPIEKDGRDVNVANIVGIGANKLSLKIKREYLTFVPTNGQIAVGGLLLFGLTAYAIYQIVKLNKQGF